MKEGPMFRSGYHLEKSTPSAPKGYRWAKNPTMPQQEGIGGGYPVVFIVAFVIIAIVFIFFLPMAFTINTAFWVQGEPILTKGIISANAISDTGVKNALNGVFSTTTQGFIDSQTIIGYAAQFAPFIVMGTIVILIILLARRQVETGLV